MAADHLNGVTDEFGGDVRRSSDALERAVAAHQPARAARVPSHVRYRSRHAGAVDVEPRDLGTRLSRPRAGARARDGRDRRRTAAAARVRLREPGAAGRAPVSRGGDGSDRARRPGRRVVRGVFLPAGARVVARISGLGVRAAAGESDRGAAEIQRRARFADRASVGICADDVPLAARRGAGARGPHRGGVCGRGRGLCARGGARRARIHSRIASHSRRAAAIETIARAEAVAARGSGIRAPA